MKHLRWLIAVLALGACGVQPDAAPRDLPEDERAVSIDVTPGGSDAVGESRIYLLEPGDAGLLRSVPREASTRAGLIEVLLAGPNDDELAEGWSSVIPPGTQLLSTRLQGQIYTINLSPEITELSGQSLAQAVAQIVYTASELEGVEAIQLRVMNEELAWPTTASGSTTGALRVYDYPNVVVSAQPDFPAVPLAPAS
jgi:hypothetical protein